ncbi:MAG: hypothetical protein JJT96_17885, partial [Opitutales bacterium]|nr:hypothetical protein [Opitutales bacterium]
MRTRRPLRVGFVAQGGRRFAGACPSRSGDESAGLLCLRLDTGCGSRPAFSGRPEADENAQTF